jgi:hypothetical protein
MGAMRNAYNIFAGKSERKRSLDKPKSRWEDTIKLYLKEINREVTD